jgi:hypothetical protein
MNIVYGDGLWLLFVGDDVKSDFEILFDNAQD